MFPSAFPRALPPAVSTGATARPPFARAPRASRPPPRSPPRTASLAPAPPLFDEIVLIVIRVPSRDRPPARASPSPRFAPSRFPPSSPSAPVASTRTRVVGPNLSCTSHTRSTTAVATPPRRRPAPSARYVSANIARIRRSSRSTRIAGGGGGGVGAIGGALEARRRDASTRDSRRARAAAIDGASANRARALVRDRSFAARSTAQTVRTRVSDPAAGWSVLKCRP